MLQKYVSLIYLSITKYLSSLSRIMEAEFESCFTLLSTVCPTNVESSFYFNMIGGFTRRLWLITSILKHCAPPQKIVYIKHHNF